MNFTFSYNREEMIRETKKAPEWIHFGAGNIFRAFPCALAEKLLSEGKIKTGIIAAEGFDEEIIEKVYEPYGNISLLVTLCGNGNVKKTPIGSVAEALSVFKNADRIREVIASPSLKMISFTITEKGYGVKSPDGEILPRVRKEAEIGCEGNNSSLFCVLTSALYERFKKGSLPIALLSMDNCSGNGDKLKNAVLTYANLWADLGYVPKEFVEYLTNEEKVAFPCSMIDKITPRPDKRVAEMLREDGFTETDIIVTAKNTYTAAFVNAEAPQYLVCEDKFPAGKLPLDEAGVIFTNRETVDKTEKMKVCTCLNPLHTSLAVFGCLLGYDLISEEMKDPELYALTKRLGYVEGLPAVTDPGILSPTAFIYEVVNERLPNPFMPDAPQRIATDTSQKLPIRFGETIKTYISRGMDMEDLKAIPLVAAGWCRYLMAIDDEGKEFTPSSDPRLEECSMHVKNISLGETDAEKIHEALYPILSDESIFAVDLYKTPLASKAEGYFLRMVSGVGAVRNVLKEEITDK